MIGEEACTVKKEQDFLSVKKQRIIVERLGEDVES